MIDLRRVVEDRIRSFLDNFRPRFVYVFFSAGKDSSAALAAAVNCCPDRVVAVFNHIVGQTHFLNSQAAINVAKELGLEIRRIVPRTPKELQEILFQEPPRPGELLYLVVRSSRYGLDYWSAVDKWGFPAPLERWRKGVRWCCAEYKKNWWKMLPPNGLYEAKPARYGIVGIKRSDSHYRSRRWKDFVHVFYSGPPLDVQLAPLLDLEDGHVWLLLKQYGIYDNVHRQYEAMGHSPNCTLCPLMDAKSFKKTIKALPTGYLERLEGVLLRLRERYVEGTFSHDKINRWLTVIEEELRRRGRKPGPRRIPHGEPRKYF